MPACCLTQGLPWAVAATVVAPSPRWPQAIFGAYLTLRLLMAWSVAQWALRRCAGGAEVVVAADPRPHWLSWCGSLACF